MAVALKGVNRRKKERGGDKRDNGSVRSHSSKRVCLGPHCFTAEGEVEPHGTMLLLILNKKMGLQRLRIKEDVFYWLWFISWF